MTTLTHLSRLFGRLYRLCPEIPLLSILWMQVKHPIHPVQEELMKWHPSDPRRPVTRHPRVVLVRRFATTLLYAVFLMGRLILLKGRFRHRMAHLKRRRFDLVAKTWQYRGVSLNGSDFYYGDLQKKLQARNVRMLILYGEPGDVGWRLFEKENDSSISSERLPEPCLIPWSAPFRVSFGQLRSSLRLLAIASKARHPLLKQVAQRASWDCLSRRSIPPALYHWIGREGVRRWRPKAFVSLYEGHGWERGLWRGAKQVDPSCRSVGYQHTILLRHNLALLRPRGDRIPGYPPEVVLCLGSRTQAMLRQGHHGSTLIPFGTFRRAPEGDPALLPAPEKRAVLVMPEGYREEARMLFEIAMETAERLPDYRFIFRCHPVLPFEQIRAELKQDPARFPNVELSIGRPIGEDYARSSVILYRGTSSVLYAILRGLRPVYLHREGAHEVDPLFELQPWRQRVSSVSELERALDRYAGEDPEQHLPAWRQAVEYVNSYAMAVNDSSIDRFLESVGLR